MVSVVGGLNKGRTKKWVGVGGQMVGYDWFKDGGSSFLVAWFLN